MDTETETLLAEAHQNPTQLDLSLLIADLKHKIATIIIKTRALFQQQSLTMMNINHLPSKTWVQPWTHVGLLCLHYA